MKTKYIAADGKQFDDELACQKYEDGFKFVLVPRWLIEKAIYQCATCLVGKMERRDLKRQLEETLEQNDTIDESYCQDQSCDWCRMHGKAAHCQRFICRGCPSLEEVEPEDSAEPTESNGFEIP